MPRRKSPATPRAGRGSDSDSASWSPKPSKDKSPKVVEHKSPRSPLSEKKKPTRVQELESQVAQLEEDLKRAKEQVNSSESWKRKAQQEAEEAKKQLVAITKELEESRQQLLELSASEEERIQELGKISQDRDRAWQSELEAVQKQHSMDSSALASAMNEIQKLKTQLERTRESEASIQELRMELHETLSFVEKLKNEVSDCKESESRALEIVGKTQMQLEEANNAVETLQLEAMKASEAYKAVALELEQSRGQVKALEEDVCTLQADLAKEPPTELEHLENEDINQLKAEAAKLRSALDAADVRYQEEYIQSTLQIRSTFEQLEHTKSELKIAKADIQELRTRLQGVSGENEELKAKINLKQPSEEQLRKLEANVAELKGRLMDRETQVQNISEENSWLKMEIERLESEKSKIADAEREALLKLGSITEEADESKHRISQQLDAAQSANCELEAELRRMKVQSDQWRKAAEAAATILSAGNNGKVVESYNSITANMSSPYSEDTDDESPKKKNTNMLKKIGVLWKKNH
ncbi:hypothetical protein PIB30_015834 [Stylosanthes scabra]|uniref:Interactor of constitutive active ROPs 2, chloroplastic n=1 Tax=Stylosanthes scabra TaxID=79078 RepID=A0ABU6R7F3_9FABA|nr:hypothetical protein [Stylosanthes scabra]